MNLELTKEEVQAVLNALATQPWHQVNLLIAKIHQQATEQLQAQSPQS